MVKKAYYEIYHADRWGIGALIGVVTDKEIADDVCKRHTRCFYETHYIEKDED